MQDDVSDMLWYAIKKWLKLGQKNDILAHFERVFLRMLSYTLDLPKDFANWKILLRLLRYRVLWQASSVHDMWLWSLKFFYWFSLHEMVPFGGFLGLYSPKFCSILQKWSEVVPDQTNTVFQKSFKILNFGSNGTHPKVYSFGTFWGPIYC